MNDGQSVGFWLSPVLASPSCLAEVLRRLKPTGRRRVGGSRLGVCGGNSSREPFYRTLLLIPLSKTPARMNLTDELRKLAELHRDGQLDDREFAAAKDRLLLTESTEPIPRVSSSVPLEARPDFEEKTFYSSRWSSGNMFFRDRLKLASDGMHFRKGAIFSSQEEHISYHAIASLRIKNGIFLSNLNIETSGGSQPIYINGLWKSDAKEVQALVQTAKSAR
jgi:hypothetical protein